MIKISVIIIVVALSLIDILADTGHGYSQIKPLSTMASISLVKPNGGELFYVGVTDTIKWSSTNITNVKIEYTTNNGTSWLMVTESIPAIAGSFLWNIPNTPSLNCKVRLSDASSPSLNVVSDSLYSIINIPNNAIVYGGKIYNTIVIGGQTWLKENLDIGIMISGDQNSTNNSVIEKYCYDNNPVNCEIYGGLYQWNEAMQYSTVPGWRGICPEGWYIPTLSDLHHLSVSVDSNSNMLKSIGQGSGNGAGTNLTGFSGLLSGYRNGYGGNSLFDDLSNYGLAWSSSEMSPTSSSYMYFVGNDSSIYFDNFFTKNYGFSVRCIKKDVVVVSPNGGDVFGKGSQVDISWVTSNVGNLKIDYTSDNGFNWVNITHNTIAANGPYKWTTPNTSSSYCKVRIADVSYPDIFDESDSSFTILENPVVPVLINPNNNTIGLINPIVISWSNSLRADKYILQISANNSFTSLTYADSSIIDTTKLIQSLSNYTQYFWRVKSVNISGESGWSEVWSFKTLGNPYASTLSVPLNNSINQPLNGISFKWTKAKDRIEAIQNYQLQIAAENTFTNLLINDSTLTDTTTIKNGFNYFSDYYWRVRASNETGWGDWSEMWKFTTIIEKPTTPILSYPLNNSKGVPLPLTAKWNKALRVEKYILQVSLQSNFSSFVFVDSTLTDTLKLLTPLANYTQYYWRVKAYNAGGESDWSEVWNFKTLGNPYASNLIEPGDNSINQTISGLIFKWTKPLERIETIQKYHYQLATDSLFTSPVVNDLTQTDTIKTINGLNYLTNYFWRVRAGNESGWGDWSETWQFTTFNNITLSAPNGNEQLAAQSSFPIVWTETILQNVKLDYSTNNGFTWLNITPSTPASALSYTWNVPITFSSQCKLRVTGVEHPLITDESDDVFSIINNRPEINFAEIPNYQNEVVYPTTGSDETLFEYLVKYSSAENKFPYSGFPKIVLDFNGNGNITEPGEGEFTMTQVDLTDTTYTDGKLYSYLTILPLGGNHKVKFIGADADGDTAVVNQALLQYRSVPLVLGGLPDAVVEAADIVFSNENPNPSQPFTMTTKVYNRSDQNIENLKVKFYKDNTMIGEQVISYLSHRSETSVSLQTVVNESGFYAMQVRIDPDNTIPEKNEFNNIALRPHVIGTTPIFGNIQVSPMQATGYSYTPFYVRGFAKYTGVFGGDQMVLGGSVKVTIDGVNYYGTTNSNGEFAVRVHGLAIGIYQASITVTDTRLTGTAATSVNVFNPGGGYVGGGGGGGNVGPDVALTSIVLSNPNPVSGEQVNVTIRARNVGIEALNNITIHFFSDNVLKDSALIPILGVGANYDLNFTAVFTGLGVHTVVALADRWQTIPEVNENNNAILATAVIRPDKPDLLVSLISKPAIVKVSKPAIFFARIENIGGVDVNTPFTVHFEVGGIQVGQATINSLGVNSSKEVSINTIFSTTGNKLLKVTADHANVILESDENNNIGQIGFLVYPLLSNLTFKTGSMVNIPIFPGVGMDVNFRIIAKNDGEIVSPATQVRFTVNGLSYTSIADVPQIAVGQEVIINSTVPFVPGFETTFISKAEIDFNNQVDELVEMDNAMTLAVVVGYGSDLAIDSANHIRTSKLYAHPGESVQLSALVTNHGTIFSTANVEFYYLNNNSQRVYINSAVVSTAANDTSASGSVSFTLPFAPVNIFAKLVNSQPPDYNLNNNEQTFLIGNRAPQIISLDTLLFAEDSSLTVNLNDHVFDGGDPLSSLVWQFTPSANVSTDYQQSTQTLQLNGAHNFYGVEFISAKVTDPQNLSDTNSVMIIVTQVIDYPTVPILASPVSGVKGMIQPIELKWLSGSETSKYNLQISSDSLFTSVVFNDSSIVDTVRSVSGLPHFTKLFWRVKGINPEAYGNWSETWNFKTLGNPYASTLMLPIDNSVNQPINGLIFKWTKAKERIETIQKYQYQLSTDSLFGSFVVNDSTMTDTNRTVNNLMFLTKYFWRVRASNETGWGDWSIAFRFTTIIEKPAAPMLASPLNNATMQLQPVTLKWNKSLRAEKYRLEVSENPAFTTLFLVDSMLTDTAKTLPPLAYPKTYYWRVSATNIGGTSNYSTVWNFRTLGLPLVVNLVTPPNNSVNQPINNLTFKWRKAGEQTLYAAPVKRGGSLRTLDRIEIPQMSINSFSNETEVEQNKGENGNGIETVLNYWMQVKQDTNNTTFHFNDSTLTDTMHSLNAFNYLTSYYWRVKGKNETGWGEFSNWNKFTTIIEKPTTPMLSTPANDTTELLQPVTVRWNSSVRAEKYFLQVSTEQIFGNIAYADSNLTDTTKLLPMLQHFTQYYWRVKAMNIGGGSEWSNVWNFRTLGSPTTVSLVYPENNAINIPVSFTFKWTKANNQELAISYWFELSIDSTTILMLDSTLTDTTKSVTGLQNDKEYYWRVKAKNEAGWNNFSAWSKFRTIVPIPETPTLSSPDNYAAWISLTPKLIWRKVTYAENYQMQVATDLSFSNIVIDDSSIADTFRVLDTLLHNTAYYWRVRAKNISGNSNYSFKRKFTTIKKPVTAPSDLTATAPEYKKVNLSWADNSDNELGFVITRKTGTSSSSDSLIIIDTVGSNITVFSDTTIADSAQYSYRVYAFSSDTISAPSNFATVTTLSSVIEILSGEIPKEYSLSQNYPNPFNPVTTIQYGLPFTSEVNIAVYDMVGQKITTLVNREQNAGYYEVTFEIDGLSSGIYFYVITAKQTEGEKTFRKVMKMILMK